MIARARRSTGESAYSSFDAEEYPEYGELLPGERIGRLPARTGAKALLRGLLLLIVLGGGWMLFGDQVTSPSRLLDQLAAVWSSMDPRAPARTERSLTAQANSSLSAGPAQVLPPVASAPPPSQPPPAPSQTTGAAEAPAKLAALPTPAAPSPEAEETDAPLPPPAADPADPYQVRALAVGLHPGLSRVLLARLTPTDYRNAGIAIQTAVAETPDDGIYVWPRTRKPDLALFQVRFVPGAAPRCRRYVVSVTKDGWLTTAPPMEKCGGPRPGQARRE